MAMLVMTVGLLGLLQSVNVAYQHTLRDRLRKEATQVAEARMHEWCRSAYDNITCFSDPNKESDEKVVGGGRWSYTISRKGEEVGSKTKKLQVGVQWSVNGVPATHEIFTLRSRRDGE